MLDAIKRDSAADKFVMFGNSEVDSLAAKMAGVDYSDITEVDVCLKLLRPR